MPVVSPNLKPATFRIDRDLLAQLEQVRDRDGVPVSEQVRRALADWLVKKGVRKADRTRARTRPRS